jgi:hypothetical protein
MAKSSGFRSLRKRSSDLKPKSASTKEDNVKEAKGAV